MVTWHALIAGAILLAGIALACLGALETLAGGMSDAPAAGSDMTKRGCTVTLVGLGAIVLAVVMMARG